jgi:hypothetical protein
MGGNQDFLRAVSVEHSAVRGYAGPNTVGFGRAALEKNSAAFLNFVSPQRLC